MSDIKQRLRAEADDGFTVPADALVEIERLEGALYAEQEHVAQLQARVAELERLLREIVEGDCYYCPVSCERRNNAREYLAKLEAEK